VNAQRAIEQYLEDRAELLEVSLATLERSVAALDFAAARRQLAGFRAFLSRHAGVEERVVFPFYERLPSVGAETTAVMRQEHGRLRRMIAGLDGLLDRRDARRALAALGTLRSVLLVHGAKEDWVIYPRVADAIPAAMQGTWLRVLG